MKIAIIGAGISGVGAAYLLSKSHDVTVFEKNDYIGGHSRTIDASIAGKMCQWILALLCLTTGIIRIF